MATLRNTTVNGVVTQTSPASDPSHLTRKGEVDAALALKLNTADASVTNPRPPNGAAGGDLAGTFPNPTLATIGAGGTGTKVTANAKGLVTAVADASSTDLPAHSSRHKVAGDDAIRLNELAAPTGAVALNSQKITGLADPTSAQDGATKAYVDARKLSDAAAPTGAVALNSQKITSLADPTSAQDAATKAYVDARRLDQAAAPTGSVALNSQKITGLADPTSAQDAATKTYVDGAVTHLKEPCRLATTGLVSLSGLGAIDGVTPSAGDRILVKDQVTGAQNGIYVAASGSWTRSTDADSGSKVKAGMAVLVAEGTVNADSGWMLTTNGAITVGTTALAFGQFTGAGQITAGTGLAKSANTLSVSFGTSGSTACVGNDSRLSDARQMAAAAANVNFNGFKATSMADPASAQDGATKAYVDARKLSDAAAPTGAVALNSQKITGLADPTSAQDAATKAYVDARRLDQAAAPTGSVALNSQKITGLADPVSAQDAATKAYVDATAQGLDVKASCRCATTADLALSGLAAIDGVTPVAGNRVLVKNQSAGAQNGIYVAAAGSWSRATDANTSAKVTGGLFVFVEEGTVNADSGWVLATNDAITLDTTALTFSQFSGAGQITAGTGLAKSGNTLSVDTANLEWRTLKAPTAAPSMGSQRLTSLADPSSAQDAATKAYVDAGNRTGATVWVDAVNGSDSTGTRGRSDLPFLTLSAAKAAANAYDLIIVLRGSYTEGVNLLKTNVHWLFMPGAIVDFTYTSVALFDDIGSAVNSKVMGWGQFYPSGGPAVRTAHGSTKLWIEGDLIEAAGATSGAMHLKGGTVNFRLREITNSGGPGIYVEDVTPTCVFVGRADLIRGSTRGISSLADGASVQMSIVALEILGDADEGAYWECAGQLQLCGARVKASTAAKKALLINETGVLTLRQCALVAGAGAAASIDAAAAVNVRLYGHTPANIAKGANVTFTVGSTQFEVDADVI
jgi:hypothetical protein